MARTERLVLVVDDEADVRFTIRRTLEPEFEVVEASDADGAVSAAAELQPALIFLDVTMPGRGGLDVLPDLRAAVPGVRIVMLTGERDLSIAAVALSGGASAYVTKPFDVDQLRAEARGRAPDGKKDPEAKPWRVEG